MSEKLTKATRFQYEQMNQMPEGEKPVFHVSAPAGWINDPNGFSVYKGKVHLFYQYHPYSICWGPMHWGHSVTDDMIKWKTEPVALAPDQEYDKRGCFSGSATEKDGKHVLIYTGVSNVQMENGSIQERQNQCIAYGDGEIYVKSPQNPVITGDMLPADCSKIDFRDPKVWKKGKNYYLIVGNKNSEQKGQVVLFSSKNLEKWKFETVLAENSTGQIGTMWECPDFFELDGTHFLICSPQNMKAQKYEFHNGNNSVYFIGNYDRDMHKFDYNKVYALDDGIDFYAPQTTLMPDGRRVMIGWMQSWDSNIRPFKQKWSCMMTIPREIKLIDGRIIQNPVREIKKYYTDSINYVEQTVEGECSFPKINGRVLDMTVEIKDGDYDEFKINFAKNDKFSSSIIYDKSKNEIEINRLYSGMNRDTIGTRKVKVRYPKQSLKLRVILDKYSVEIFVNDGSQVLSMTYYTPVEADEISFECNNTAVINIEKHGISVR